MTEMLKNDWNPTDVSHPGETLLETLEAIDMQQAELALRMGRPRKTINEIIKGKAAISEETALQLEPVLGVPASFWLARQRDYDAACARRVENETLLNEVEWLKEISYTQLVKRRWLPKRSSKVESMRDALGFFQCGSVKGFRQHFEATGANFRKSTVFASEPLAVATWLRQCKHEASRVEVDAFDAERLKASLPELRTCTLLEPVAGLAAARRLLSQAGVALVWVEPLPRSRLSGAAFPMHDRRVVALTLRHGSDDHLWFTVFHELGHVLLHDGSETFVDADPDSSSQREVEADRFARDTLMAPDAWERLLSRPRFPERVVVEFAREIGVSPGVVLGRLQHDALVSRSSLNHLKQWMEWRDGAVHVKG